MFRRILEYLTPAVPPDPSGHSSQEQPSTLREYDSVLAVTALLLEMASIDGEFTREEQDRITEILRSGLHVSPRDIGGLMEKASTAARTAGDYWQFAQTINEHYTMDEKIHIIELLWSVVYTDGTVERHEDYLIRKLARLLNLSHQDLIGAKLRMKP